MSHFQRHLFICTNERNDPCRQSCGDNQAGATAVDYLKGHAHAAGLIGAGKLRISKSGCLGRCEQGPAMVIYPEGRWYTYVDEADLADILQHDLIEGQAVPRLLIDPIDAAENE